MSSNTTIRWQFAPYRELTTDELYSLLDARQQVFVVEQNCPYRDTDGCDQDAHHLIGWIGDTVGAYLRILPPGMKYTEPSIGRVITSKEARGGGYGKALMREGIARCEQLYPGQGIRISAQQYLERFYGEFGFRTVSDAYMEDGILHIEMVLG